MAKDHKSCRSTKPICQICLRICWEFRIYFCLQKSFFVFFCLLVKVCTVQSCLIIMINKTNNQPVPCLLVWCVESPFEWFGLWGKIAQNFLFVFCISNLNVIVLSSRIVLLGEVCTYNRCFVNYTIVAYFLTAANRRLITTPHTFQTHFRSRRLAWTGIWEFRSWGFR